MRIIRNSHPRCLLCIPVAACPLFMSMFGASVAPMDPGPRSTGLAGRAAGAGGHDGHVIVASAAAAVADRDSVAPLGTVGEPAQRIATQQINLTEPLDSENTSSATRPDPGKTKRKRHERSHRARTSGQGFSRAGSRRTSSYGRLDVVCSVLGLVRQVAVSSRKGKA